MGSMDDLFVRLRDFRMALERFDEALAVSVTDMQTRHDAVAPLWQDETRRTYDRAWEPLRESMDVYLRRTAPAYRDFLDGRIRALDGYLHGDD